MTTNVTTLAHDNIWLHRMLTDQGACTHEHEPDSFEDDGDGESGPHLTGGPAFDRYTSESHEIIIDGSGTIVHCEAIDWDLYRFAELMATQNGSYPDEPIYKRQRKAGEDWQVRFRDEDGGWWSQGGGCWTSTRAEADFFHFTQACQIAHKHNVDTHDRLAGQAIVYHADDCVRCMTRKRQGAAATYRCGSCGELI